LALEIGTKYFNCSETNTKKRGFFKFGRSFTILNSIISTNGAIAN